MATFSHLGPSFLDCSIKLDSFICVYRCVLVFPKIMFSNTLQVIFSCGFKKYLWILTYLYRITDYNFRFQLLVFILVTALLVSIKD